MNSRSRSRSVRWSILHRHENDSRPLKGIRGPRATSGFISRPPGDGRRGKGFAALFSTALVAVLASSVASGASVAPKTSVGKSKAIKPDYAFYKGKTITFIVPKAVGTNGDLEARAVQPGMQQTLGATINIVNVPGTTQVLGEDEVAAAAPDGLTIGQITPITVMSNYYSNNTAPLNFHVEQMSYIGSLTSPTQPFFACAGSPYTNLHALLTSKTPVKILDVSGVTEAFVRALLTAYKTPFKLIPGYQPTTAATGCQRGDGDAAILGMANAVNASGTALNPGLTALLLESKVYPGALGNWLNATTPTVAAYAKKYPPKGALAKEAMALTQTVFGFSTTVFGPQGIAKNKLLALIDAYKFAMQQPATKQAMLNLSANPKYVSPAGVVPFFKAAFKHQKTDEEILGSA